MTKGRDSVVESLGDVVELVRVRKQSGLLSVERFQNGRFEEGEIYFQNGKPTYAHSGQMSGQEALVWLLSWRQVHFTFLADETHLPVNISAAITANDVVAVAPNLPASPSSRSLPVRTPGNAPDFPSRLPPVSQNMASKRERIADNEHGQNNSNGDAVTESTPGLEWLIPRKLGKDRDVLSLPLTRPQRSIYLLVDGRRTISDLSRCTRKSLQEIERLLSELQERGLVTM
jgi:hypothetical protein